MSGLIRLVHNRLVVPRDASLDFTGLNVLVTGANVGLGFEAAVKFCTLGANKVILGVRNPSKGEAAKVAIENRSGRRDCVEVWELDMLSYPSIKGFADKITALDHLDVAVLNAGVYSLEYTTSKYGRETTLQVNTLSTVLLAMYLLPKLEKTQKREFTPSLVMVSSSLYKSVDLSIYDEDDMLAFANEKDAFGRQQYAKSKLLLAWATRDLAERQPRTTVSNSKSFPTVKITSVSPGACRSQLARDFSSVMQIFIAIFAFLLFRTAEQGARNYVRAVKEGKHGEIYKDGVNEP
jgi:NAD(P)-dependent dehydrogenase (short-subunit alcohol dehydrogenase family)